MNNAKAIKKWQELVLPFLNLYNNFNICFGETFHEIKFDCTHDSYSKGLQWVTDYI